MANSFAKITRLLGANPDPAIAILPGNKRRRAISFHNMSQTGLLSMDIQPITNALISPWIVQNSPFFLLLTYQDWGDVVTYPWYVYTNGNLLAVQIIEMILE